MEHSHFLLALTFLRGGLRKAALFPRIVCRVYLSNLARMKAFLKYCSRILIVLLYCCFKTTSTDKHWRGELEFFKQDEFVSLFLQRGTVFKTSSLELVDPVACLALLTLEKDE